MYNPGQAQNTRPVNLEWRNKGGWWGLSFKIFLLRIITLNIYSFWGKTEIRRKVWSSIHLQGQPLEYTGRGMELFLGFITVFFLVLLPFIAILTGIQLYVGPNPKDAPMIMLYSLPFYIVLIYLIGAAQYTARRYRLTRTNWRGIRGNMSGSSWSYAWTAFWTTLLVPLTLGWIIPWQAVKLNRVLTRETRFGETPLDFNAKAGPLYGPFTVMWFGAIIGISVLSFAFGMIMVGLITGYVQSTGASPETLGQPGTIPPALMYVIIPLYIAFVFILLVYMSLVSSYYFSRQYNHFMNSTTIHNARFQANTKTWPLVGLSIGNYLLLLFTLGLALPIIVNRTARFYIQNTWIEGNIDFERIAQSQAQLDKTGEGLAQAFDIDVL